MSDSNPRPSISKLDRRTFLRLTGLAGGGLMLGVGVGCAEEGTPSNGAGTEGEPSAFQPSAYLQISEEGIFVYAPSPEIGQGVKTSLPMILVEELDAAWEDVTVLQAEIDAERYEHQFAGGSRSIPSHWMPMRQAGAVARQMLATAAALRWEVDAAEVDTRDSRAVHTPTGRTLSYRELASAAAELPVPDADEVTLESPDEWTLMGRRIGGVDNRPLVTGEPLFGIDKRLPDMLYATYVKCPSSGGTVASANLEAVKQQPGVVDAFVLEGNGEPTELLDGVAIIARDTWCAFKARDALEVEWDLGNAASDSWSAAVSRAAELANAVGEDRVADEGDVERAFEQAAKTVSGVYQYAFVSHAQLEPQNTTAWFHDDTMELWAPTQTPQSAEEIVSSVLGIAPDKVVLHQMRAGGGFGRRLMNDAVVEAAAIAQRVNGPVKLTWMREDDMAHDFYRAGGFHALKGAIDADGNVVGWDNHFVSFTEDGEEPVRGGGIRGDIDPGPFIPNYRITQTLLPWQTPCGWWRAPGSNVIAFAHQCFLHELAVQAGRDHLELLLDLMGEPRWLEDGNESALHTGRAAGVIRKAAEEAGWGRSLPEGRGLGLAFYFSHDGHVAQVAEVSIGDNKRLDVHRVTVAADVGPIINLSGAENQVKGSVVDGLSAMLAQRVTFEDGRAQQLNFHQYPLLRIARAPEIDVHFIRSDFPPTGLGEPALPPLAPAVANAIYAATGERVRQMPLTEAGYT